jgi:hypothetical protein
MERILRIAHLECIVLRQEIHIPQHPYIYIMEALPCWQGGGVPAGPGSLLTSREDSRKEV